MPGLVPPAVPAGRLRSRPQPTLPVDELLLRPWQLDDADAVVEAYRDPAIQRWHVRSMTRDEALAWLACWPGHWQAETRADWAVTRAGSVVGRAGLRGIDLAEGHAEVGYWTVPAARGRNIAARAVGAVADWMFAEIGLHRLELSHATDNPASCRVAGKAGFDYEGTRRQQGWHADGWHDMHLHARLAAPELPR
ncbi:MAG TPA: GNAT family N-acetyltransferase [Jatrophihabitans sp.]|nr:GNAT family N-acetyltransferase [Jatrophihabitans sp.]